MRYVVGGRGWPVRIPNSGRFFHHAGTVIDTTQYQYMWPVYQIPPPDALPLDAATYLYMGSLGGVVGLGYQYVDPKLVVFADASFSVVAPATTVAGVPFNVTVTALDVLGRVVSGYTGTVHFTSNDPLAVLPPDSTLSSGIGVFSVTLKSSGLRTVNVGDGVATGSASVSVTAAAAASFSVVAPATGTSNQPLNFTVTALDAFGNLAPSYAGTVHFTSSDLFGIEPVDSTLTAGVGTFSMTFSGTGNQTITATDTVNPSITGTSGVVALAWGPPQVSGANPTIYGDFSGAHWWAAGAVQPSFSAWLTAIGATLTRSTTATYLQGGVVKTAAVNTARFPTDLGGNPLGIRLTGAVTNIWLQSSNMMTAPWGGSGSTISASSDSPDGGVSNAFLITSLALASF